MSSSPQPSFKHRVKSAIARTVLQVRGASPFRPSPRVLILYLFADRGKYPDSFRHLQSLAAGCGESFIVKINNFAATDYVQPVDANTVEIAGDNSSWEFSGWKKGMAYAQREIRRDFDYVLFVNDAFLNQAQQGRDLLFFRKLFNRFTLPQIKGDVLGEVSHVTKRHVIKDRAVDDWIKSSTYCMAYPTAKKIAFTYINPEELALLVPVDFPGEGITRPSTLVNEEFRVFVEKWLVEQWQWKVKPTAKNWSFLRGKLAAILNERLLSAELKANGCRLLIGTGGTFTGAARIIPFQRPPTRP